MSRSTPASSSSVPRHSNSASTDTRPRRTISYSVLPDNEGKDIIVIPDSEPSSPEGAPLPTSSQLASGLPRSLSGRIIDIEEEALKDAKGKGKSVIYLDSDDDVEVRDGDPPASAAGADIPFTPPRRRPSHGTSKSALRSSERHPGLAKAKVETETPSRLSSTRSSTRKPRTNAELIAEELAKKVEYEAEIARLQKKREREDRAEGPSSSKQTSTGRRKHASLKAMLEQEVMERHKRDRPEETAQEADAGGSSSSGQMSTGKRKRKSLKATLDQEKEERLRQEEEEAAERAASATPAPQMHVIPNKANSPKPAADPPAPPPPVDILDVPRAHIPIPDLPPLPDSLDLEYLSLDSELSEDEPLSSEWLAKCIAHGAKDAQMLAAEAERGRSRDTSVASGANEANGLVRRSGRTRNASSANLPSLAAGPSSLRKSVAASSLKKPPSSIRSNDSASQHSSRSRGQGAKPLIIDRELYPATEVEHSSGGFSSDSTSEPTVVVAATPTPRKDGAKKRRKRRRESSSRTLEEEDEEEQSPSPNDLHLSQSVRKRQAVERKEKRRKERETRHRERDAEARRKPASAAKERLRRGELGSRKPALKASKLAEGTGLRTSANSRSRAQKQDDAHLPPTSLRRSSRHHANHSDDGAPTSQTADDERDSPPLVKRIEPEVFAAISTEKENENLSAMEIIARLRNKEAVARGIEESPPAPEAPTSTTDAESAANGTEENGVYDPYALDDESFRKRDRADDADDEDDDELADPSALVAAAQAFVAKPKPAPPPATTSPVIEAKRSSPAIVLKQRPQDRAKFSLDTMYKKKEAQLKRGYLGFEEAQREMESYRFSSDSDSDSDVQRKRKRGASSDMDEDEELPDLPLRVDRPRSNGTVQPKLENGHAYGSALERLKRTLSVTPSGQDPSDESGEGSTFAAAAAVKEELDMEVQLDKERKEAKERCIWRQKDGQLEMPELRLAPAPTEGCHRYLILLYARLQKSLFDPQAFPTELLSCALTYKMLAPVMLWLFQIVSHPQAHTTLANRALLALIRLVTISPAALEGLEDDYYEDMFNDGDPKIYLTAVRVETVGMLCSLDRMGAQKEMWPPDLRTAMERRADLHQYTEKGAYDGEKVAVSKEQRSQAAWRVLYLWERFLDLGRILEITTSHILLLVHLASEQDEHDLRDACMRLLHRMLSKMPDSQLVEVRTAFLAACRTDVSPAKQFELLLLLPYNTPGQKRLVRSITAGLLFGDDPAPSQQKLLEPVKQEQPPSLPVPTFAELGKLLGKPATDSIFNIGVRNAGEVDDGKLYYSIMLLQFLLSDLSVGLIGSRQEAEGDGEGSSKAFVREIDNIASILEGLDSRLRPDVRASNPQRTKAKNALTRLHHALEYQVQFADRRARKADREKRMNGKEHQVDLVTGQMSLQGFLKQPC